MRAVVGIAVVMAALATVAQAGPETGTAAEPELARLVGELGSPDSPTVVAAIAALADRREPAAVEVLVALQDGRIRVLADGRVVVAEVDETLRDPVVAAPVRAAGPARSLRVDNAIRRALGPDAVIDKMRAAPLRLGGIDKSYHERLLIVGDAAGHIDPLTGEGTALLWSKALGKPVQYAGDDMDAWEKQNLSYGIPPVLAYDFRLMYEWFQKQGLKAGKEDVAELSAVLGHPPRKYTDYVAEMARAWKPT
jgi:hypothetical protein